MWHGGYDTNVLVNSGGTFTFSSVADYLAGHAATFTQRLGNRVCCFGVTQLGVWAQDDMALTKTVNLALGLREEEESDVSPALNVAPRGQLEWAPTRVKRTTFRIGAGVFYAWFNPTDVEQTVRVDGIHQHDILIEHPSYPNPYATEGLPVLPAGRYLRGAGMRLPRTVRGSMGVDHTEGAWVLHADYARLSGTDLFRGTNLNAPDGSGLRPDPEFANVIAVTSTGRSRTDALTTSVTYTNAKRNQFLRFNYTWAHAWNNTDGPFFLPVDALHADAEWGPSNQDVHQRLSGNANTAIFHSHILTGTYWNYSSAAPYTITTGLDSNQDGIFNERPPGVRRNSTRGYAQFNHGMFVSWAWPRFPQPPASYFSRRVEVGISATNLWNRVNRINMSGVLTSPFFGQAVSATQPRRVYVWVNTGF